MEQPLHSIRAQQTSFMSPSRVVSLTVSTVLVFGFGWAISSGLANTIVEKVNDVIQVDVLKDKIEKKLPPPPPVEIKAPPPPFVPPPDIVIQQDAAPQTTAITTQSVKATPPPISAPASIGKPHFCGNDYPAISKRLGETGVTKVGFTITTDGHVENVHIVDSSGSERLDSAAVSCVTTWHYKAAIKDNVPVAVPWQAAVQWKLQ